MNEWLTLFEDFLPIFTAKRDCIQGTPTKVTWVNPQVTGFTVDGDGKMPGEGLP